MLWSRWLLELSSTLSSLHLDLPYHGSVYWSTTAMIFGDCSWRKNAIGNRPTNTSRKVFFAFDYALDCTACLAGISFTTLRLPDYTTHIPSI